MNYTQNYHLPQWEETDRVMRTDFNQMCADMEEGLKQNAAAASIAKTRADKGVSDAAVAQNAANAAKAAADTAQASANQAQTTANAAYCHDFKPYATGTYVGTGHLVEVDVGFRPSFVIVSGQGYTSDSIAPSTILAIGPDAKYKHLVFQPYGFTVHPTSAGYPKIDVADLTYAYIAFR